MLIGSALSQKLRIAERNSENSELEPSICSSWYGLLEWRMRIIPFGCNGSNRHLVLAHCYLPM
jgi:hypothetical protein